MSDMSLFKGNSMVSSDLFKSLQEVDDNLLSGSSDYTSRRISFKGSKFREIVNGDQVNVSKEDSMNIVIVNAAPLSRVYYGGEYDPSNVTPPTCWSDDTKTPAESVPVDKRMSPTCAQCPMNIKGSGQGETRACKFSQRLAIAPELDLGTVYQVSLPATSIFGDSKDGNMPMQAYAKFLRAHNTPAIAVVTKMYFDENSDVPKLYFKPERPLDEAELAKAVELKDSEEATKAVTFTVSQTDKVSPAPEAVKKQAVKEAPAPEKEEIAEPTKAASTKPKKQAVEESDLKNIIDEWDD